MTSPPVPARTTLPLRLPWTTAAGAAAVAGFITLRTLASPASAPSTLTIRLLELGLAASAVYLLDDAAVGMTTVAPRSLWRRRALSLGSGSR